jgi:hypothetical protein
MTPVLIYQREQGEGHPVDEALYRKLHELAHREGMAMKATGEYTDAQIIASHTRAFQQLAANSTALAQELEIDVELKP